MWGTGKAEREFIYAPDLADAAIHAARVYTGTDPINLGSNAGVSIAELASTIREVVGYEGELIFDKGKPDGMPKKYLDSTVLTELGWQAKTPLREALTSTYAWYLQQQDSLSLRRCRYLVPWNKGCFTPVIVLRQAQQPVVFTSAP